MQQLSGHSQGNEDTSGLLEDLRDAVDDYKVRLQSLSPFLVLARIIDGTASIDTPTNMQIDCKCLPLCPNR